MKELQSLYGFLNFIGRAVFPGRTFTRRMYAKFSKSFNTSVFTSKEKTGTDFKLKDTIM